MKLKTFCAFITTFPVLKSVEVKILAQLGLSLAWNQKSFTTHAEMEISFSLSRNQQISEIFKFNKFLCSWMKFNFHAQISGIPNNESCALNIFKWKHKIFNYRKPLIYFCSNYYFPAELQCSANKGEDIFGWENRVDYCINGCWGWFFLNQGKYEKFYSI